MEWPLSNRVQRGESWLVLRPRFAFTPIFRSSHANGACASPDCPHGDAGACRNRQVNLREVL